jgi:hypothetical protein
VFVMKLPRFMRAVAGLMAVEWESKQGAACNVRAAIAATRVMPPKSPKMYLELSPAETATHR